MNKEKYSDPTAEQAIAHVMKEYRRKKKQEGGTAENNRRGRQYQRSLFIPAKQTDQCPFR